MAIHDRPSQDPKSRSRQRGSTISGTPQRRASGNARARVRAMSEWTTDVMGRRASSSTSGPRSEEHTSELQSLMRISYAVFCLKKKKNDYNTLIYQKRNQ